MSEMSNGKNDQRDRPLLSLASWMTPEEGESRPAAAASQSRRASGSDAGQPSTNPLLTALARNRPPDLPAVEPRRLTPRAFSFAHLLRRRSEKLARQPLSPPVEEIHPVEPDVSEVWESSGTELSRSRRLKLPRSGGDEGRPQTKKLVPADNKPKPGAAPETSVRGVAAAIAGLVRRSGSGASRSQDAAPPPPERPAPPRFFRGSREASPKAAAGAVGAGNGATAAENRAEVPPRDIAPPVGRGDAGRGPAAAPPAASAPAQPAIAPYQPPAPIQPAAYPQYLPPSHPPAFIQPAMPWAAAPVTPAWTPMMPVPVGQMFHPMAPAAMVPAPFYWPQHTPAPPWAMGAPAVWQAPLQPAPSNGQMMAAPAEEAVARPPHAANDAPPRPPRFEEPYPAHDPLTSEIDEVRERLRAFGESLRDLRRTRTSRQIG